jgi:hypothetical protein
VKDVAGAVYLPGSPTRHVARVKPPGLPRVFFSRIFHPDFAAPGS